MTAQLRADLYSLLAELLAEPSDDGALPISETLTQLSVESEAARHYLDLLAGLPSETENQRRERYASLFAAGRPRFWLYESAAKTGKILGPETFELANLYRAVGLETSGAELPDHVSLELAFLSYLASQAESLTYEQQFLEKHGAWIIDLGRALQNSGDAMYAPIGALLADWLTESLTPCPSPVGRGVGGNVPAIPRADDCTLCGFCAQVCPTRALKVMQNAEGDFLSLNVAECIHCSKCERICDFHAIVMNSLSPIGRGARGESIILRQSPHALCKTCGKPIASQAEMDYIASQVGDADWQHLCLDCRAYAIR